MKNIWKYEKYLVIQQLLCFLDTAVVCSTVGYLSVYWNRVFMPERCRVSSASSDEATLIRGAGSWANLGQAFEVLMRWYNWRHITILSDQVPTLSSCSYGASAIVNWLTTDEAQADNFSVTFVPLAQVMVTAQLSLLVNGEISPSSRCKLLCIRVRCSETSILISYQSYHSVIPFF